MTPPATNSKQNGPITTLWLVGGISILICAGSLVIAEGLACRASRHQLAPFSHLGLISTTPVPMPPSSIRVI